MLKATPFTLSLAILASVGLIAAIVIYVGWGWGIAATIAVVVTAVPTAIMWVLTCTRNRWSEHK